MTSVPNPGLIFSPGWAMPGNFFAPLQTALLQHFPTARIHHLQPGYFMTPSSDKAPALPDEPPETRWFGIGHSYGFIRLMRFMQAQQTSSPTALSAHNIWHGLISLCGFTHFCAQPEKPGVAPIVADALRQGVQENCDAALRRFYRLCSLPGTVRPATVVQPHTLLDDLDDLLTCDVIKPPLIPLLALASSNDAVVPPILTRTCFAESTLHWHAHAGHALGWREADWCAAHIAAWIQQSGNLLGTQTTVEKRGRAA